MPHKAKSKSRHHIPKQRRRITNWATYEESLPQRGSLIVWFSEDGRCCMCGQPMERKAFLHEMITVECGQTAFMMRPFDRWPRWVSPNKSQARVRR